MESDVIVSQNIGTATKDNRRPLSIFTTRHMFSSMLSIMDALTANIVDAYTCC